MTLLADNDVVMHDDAERLGRLDDGAGHLDVGTRGFRIAGRVVVDQPAKLKKYLNFNIVPRTRGKVVPLSGGCYSCQLRIIPMRPA